jgi:4'-phosphopantetheinyl transferase
LTVDPDLVALDGRDVRLHCAVVPMDGGDHLLPQLAEDLTRAENAAARRFVHERHRFLYAFSHVYLRRTLGRYLRVPAHEVPIVQQGRGRPELDGAALRFNLSHTDGLVLVGVTAVADVGVDAERISARRSHDGLVERVFVAEERSEWDGTDEDFVTRWTLKEAYMKARGLGLALALHTFGVLTHPIPRLVCASGVDDPRAWQFFSFAPTAEHRAAAAVRLPPGTPARWIVTDAPQAVPPRAEDVRP